MTSTSPTFGFISVLEIESVGYCGGLLIVSQIGRPLEFHCSAPVTVNRAQQILYGKTYRSFLCCEQIGLSLIDKSKTNPSIFVANTPWLSGLGEFIETPVVILRDMASANFSLEDLPPGSFLKFNDFEIWHHDESDNDLSHLAQRQQKIQSLLSAFTRSLTLDEPFERIEKAIEEAQAIAR